MNATTTLLKRIGVAAVVAVGVMICLLVVPAAAKDKYKVIERFEATAMNLEAGRASLVEIGIYGWSTDEDRQGLIEAFDSKGNNGLYKNLGKQDERAFVKLPNTMGYQMRYAIQAESDGKRKIILATDRPIGMGEVMRDTDTQSNNISVVVLELDAATGKGTGTMIFGAEFGVDKKTGQIEIESVTTNPTKFTKVESKPVKHKD